MTFEEFYKILYEKYDIARANYSDKRIEIKSSIAIDTYDLFDLIDGLKETYAPKIKLKREQIRIYNRINHMEQALTTKDKEIEQYLIKEAKK